MSEHPTTPNTAVSGPQLTVQGIRFPLPTQPRYAEGHVLTSVEASVLNQTFAENLRNNWANSISSPRTYPSRTWTRASSTRSSPSS